MLITGFEKGTCEHFRSRQARVVRVEPGPRPAADRSLAWMHCPAAPDMVTQKHWQILRDT